MNNFQLKKAKNYKFQFIACMLGIIFSVVTTSALARSVLTKDMVLGKNEALVSDNKRFMAILQEDGNFVIYDTRLKNPSWQSNTSDAVKLVMNSTGVLALLNSEDNVVWESSGTTQANAFLTLRDNGDMVLQNPDLTVYWRTDTKADGILEPETRLTPLMNEKVCSPESCIPSGGSTPSYFALHSSGTLALRSNNGKTTYWAQGNQSGSDYVIMQGGDGNLVLRKGDNGQTVVWHAGIDNNPYAFLVVGSDTLTIYTKDAVPLWSTTYTKKRHCHKFNFTCKADKEFKNVSDWVSDATEDTTKMAGEMDTAVAGVATKLANNSADLSETQYSAIISSAKNAYQASASAVVSLYNEAVAALDSLLTDAIQAAFTRAAAAFFANYESELVSTSILLSQLSGEQKAAWNRILFAIPQGHITAQVADDLKLVMTDLKFITEDGQAGANIPAGFVNSSVAITLTNTLEVGEEGAGVGASVSYGIAMDILPNSDGTRNYAIVVYGGAVIGTSANVALMEASLLWKPGTIAETSNGINLGMGVKTPLLLGGGTALSWPVDNIEKFALGMLNGNLSAKEMMPGFALTLSSLPGFNATVSEGYSATVYKAKF